MCLQIMLVLRNFINPGFTPCFNTVTVRVNLQVLELGGAVGYQPGRCPVGQVGAMSLGVLNSFAWKFQSMLPTLDVNGDSSWSNCRFS